MAQSIKVINHGSNAINLQPIQFNSTEARPIELHFNTNGSVNNEPYLAIVLETRSGFHVYGQLELETLQNCLQELGYKIEPIPISEQVDKPLKTKK
jgi:hypothetical protein